MRAPSARILQIAAADPALFEHLMAKSGMRITPRDNDPLRTSVQEEIAESIAPLISEDAGTRIRLKPEVKAIKEMAEKLGYVVVLESPYGDPRRHEEYDQLETDAREFEEAQPLEDEEQELTGQAAFDDIFGGAPTQERKISTQFVNPPIPHRGHDWSANHDDYEPGGLIGYGETEDEAIQSLKDTY